MAEKNQPPRSTAVNVLLLVGVVLGLAALIEFVSCAFGARSGVEIRELTPLYSLQEHPDLGYSLTPNTHHRAAKALADGTACYDVVYHTDEFGRRTVFQRYDAGNPHLLLFGGSVTFGEGLSDEETLQYQLARSMPGHNVYNYAVHGYGPPQALAQLESGEIEAQVASGGGSAIYGLIPSHISRTIGDTRAFWMYGGPYYLLDDRGRLRRRGSFATGRPVTTRLYRWFRELKRRSHFLRWIDLDLPLRLSDDDVRLTARVLAEAGRAYRDRFAGRFYVLFHPTWDLGVEANAHRHRLLCSLLSQSGVELLDEAGAGLGPDEIIRPGCDRHPNGRLNRRLADALAARID